MTPEEDVDELLNELVPLVHEQLAAEGGVYPFGAAITAEGDKEIIRVVDDEEDPAELENPVEELIGALEERIAQGGVRLVAIVTDVTVDFEEGRGDEDAIHFAFEHKDGDAIEVFMPYTRTGDEISVGDLVAQHGIRRFFGTVDIISRNGAN